MTKKEEQRIQKFLPNNEPKYVTIYDNGGESFDQYTVIFTGPNVRKRTGGNYWVVGLSEHPFSPCGFGQHMECPNRPDITGNSWGPVSIGRKNHLGTRITFSDLPVDCKKAVMQDYLELWDLPH